MKSALIYKFTNSTVARSTRILPKSDKPKIIAVIVMQVSLGFLDLIGVAAFGVLGALAVTGVQSQQPGNRVSEILTVLGLSNVSFQQQVAFLGIGAAAILVLRTFLSVIATKKIYFFLSRRGAFISSTLVSRLLSQSMLKVQSRSTQETVYSVTAGVTSITLGVLGTLMTLIADGSLLIIMLIGLFIVDPVIALTTLVFFGALGLVLYRVMNVKAHELGYLVSELNVASNEKIIEVLESYRESVVRNRRDYYSKEIGALRLKLADVLAELQFMPSVSKYVIESGMVVGALIIAGIQFGLKDAANAVATLSVFMAAGTRIAPASLRFQQSLVSIKSSLGSAMPTLEMIERLSSIPAIDTSSTVFGISHSGFNGKVKIEDMSFTYPGKSLKALDGISLTIDSGQSLAIVGPSGAGKTTLIDVLLGVLQPDHGQIFVSDNLPLDAISEWPGAMAYVPQDVLIARGSIRKNVALGFPIEVASDELVWRAIRDAQLEDFVKSLPEGLDTEVGQRGARISGGQRQRLGIARAMFTRPKLLVLDEATSSLDGQTEADISAAIQGLHGSVTIVMIAHRLSTVLHADQVVYMSEGKILSQGTFNEVRAVVPDFDRQAQLMGL
jgi:ABC-type multidrug transport system fused ATPase/permease subunit